MGLRTFLDNVRNPDLIIAYGTVFLGAEIGREIETQMLNIFWAFSILDLLITFFLLGLIAILASRQTFRMIAFQNQKCQIMHKVVDESGDAIILVDANGN